MNGPGQQMRKAVVSQLDAVRVERRVPFFDDRWGALICVVSMYVIAAIFLGDVKVAANLADSYGSEIVSMAKFGEATIAEPIIVANFAPNVEPRGARSVGSRTEGLRIDLVATFLHAGACRDNDIPFKSIFGNGEFDQKSLGAKHAVNEPFNLSCGQIADVVKANIAGIGVSCSKQFNATRPNADVGALKNPRVFDLNEHADAGGEPKADSGYSQRAGEESEPPSVIGKSFFGTLLGGFVIGCAVGITLCGGLWWVIRG
jgi:hypothetical protein